MIRLVHYNNVNEARIATKSLIDTVENSNVRRLLYDMVTYDNFWKVGASRSHHVGEYGLAEHSIQVAQAALNIREMTGRYEEISSTLLIAGGLLHDIGKAYVCPADIRYMNGSEHHSIIGANRVARKMYEMGCFSDKEMEDLVNLITYHHAGLDDELPGVKQICTFEAFIVQLADFISTAHNLYGVMGLGNTLDIGFDSVRMASLR